MLNWKGSGKKRSLPVSVTVLGHLPKISGVLVGIPSAHELLNGGLEYWLDPLRLSNAS
jgi:hypothetical protein